LVPANISKVDLEGFAIRAAGVFGLQPGNPIDPLISKRGDRIEF
jgi:hypothetical protein